jgi:hypothetical protein
VTRPAPLAPKSAAAPLKLPPTRHDHKEIKQAFGALLAQSPRLQAQPIPEGPPGVESGAGRAGPACRRRETLAETASDSPQHVRVTPDPLDPMTRVLAVPAGGPPVAPVCHPATPPMSAPDEVLLDRVVKRLSWGGSGKRGTARIELGAGSLAGATLLLQAEGRELTLEVEGASPEAVRDFAARLGERLDAKGIVLAEVRQG